jgi:hypothetical protein
MNKLDIFPSGFNIIFKTFFLKKTKNMKNFIVKPDAKGRICLGKFLKDGGVDSCYKVEIKKDGEISLKPYVEISLKEFKSLQEKTVLNDETLNNLLNGLKEPLADILRKNQNKK